MSQEKEIILLESKGASSLKTKIHPVISTYSPSSVGSIHEATSLLSLRTRKLYFTCSAVQTLRVIGGLAIRNMANYFLEVQINLYHTKPKLSFFFKQELYGNPMNNTLKMLSRKLTY